MTSIKTIDPNSISQPELHAYLLSAVAPRPIAFASTIDKAGNINLSPFSFFNVFSSNPPIMVFSPARRGHDSSNKDTFDNIMEVRETVINIVNYPIVEQMSLASTSYAPEINEFVKAGFTQVPSTKVKPPRVGEAPVAFECVIHDVIELGQGGGAGNLVICRVVLIHLQEKYLDEKGKLDTTKLDLVGRMGGIWYTRASGESLFQIPKPLRTKGIGIDQLPESIRNSATLTGNNLGRLANVEQLPDNEEVALVKASAEVQAVLKKLANQPEDRKNALHKLAKQYLEDGELEKALSVLLLE